MGTFCWMSSSEDSSSDSSSDDRSKFLDVVAAVDIASFATSSDSTKPSTKKPSLRNKYFGNDDPDDVKPKFSNALQNQASNRLDALLGQSISFSSDTVAKST